jgi:acyl dehydratase
VDQLIAEGDMGQGDIIGNHTFDEIAIGDSASLSRTLSKDDIALFAIMSGDVNPAHLDESYAQAGMFHRIIGHGMWGAPLSPPFSARVSPVRARSILGRICIFGNRSVLATQSA